MPTELEASQIAKIAQWLKSGSINIFGLPFSGKDTQAKRLAAYLQTSVIGGGDILRNREGVPERIRQIIDKGILPPSEDYLRIVTPYLSQETFRGRPLILSSIGRWHGEEEGIMQAAAVAGHPIKSVISLKLDEATVRKRWQISQSIADRGTRADDSAGVLDTRLKEFRKKTWPVIDFYRQKGLLVEVDGTAAPDEVTAQILSRLSELAQS